MCVLRTPFGAAQGKQDRPFVAQCATQDRNECLSYQQKRPQGLKPSLFRISLGTTSFDFAQIGSSVLPDKPRLFETTDEHR